MEPEARLEQFRQEFQSGEVLATEGEKSEGFYILASGQIGIYRDGQKIAQIKEPGSYLGEMAAILNTRRTATIKAESPVTCYVLPTRCLDSLIASSPQVAMKLLRTLAERLDETTRKLTRIENRLGASKDDDTGTTHKMDHTA